MFHSICLVFSHERWKKEVLKGYSGYFVMLLCFLCTRSLVLTLDHCFSSGDLLDLMCVFPVLLLLKRLWMAKSFCEIVVGTDVWSVLLLLKGTIICPSAGGASSASRIAGATPSDVERENTCSNCWEMAVSLTDIGGSGTRICGKIFPSARHQNQSFSSVSFRVFCVWAWEKIDL